MQNNLSDLDVVKIIIQAIKLSDVKINCPGEHGLKEFVT